MQQVLWHDTVFDALGAAVQAAGGAKKVAGKLWPTLDAGSANSRLRGALNPDHAQKLCPAELLMIARLARDEGDNSLMDFLARELGYEIKPLASAEVKKRALKARIAWHASEIARISSEDE